MSFLSGLFGGQKMPAIPPLPAPVAAPVKADTTAADEAARRRAMAAQGRASTILTDPLGLTGSATGKRQSLLGGGA